MKLQQKFLLSVFTEQTFFSTQELDQFAVRTFPRSVVNDLSIKTVINNFTLKESHF